MAGGFLHKTLGHPRAFYGPLCDCVALAKGWFSRLLKRRLSTVAHQVAESLSGKARELKIVDLPDLPEKGDVGCVGRRSSGSIVLRVFCDPDGKGKQYRAIFWGSRAVFAAGLWFY